MASRASAPRPSQRRARNAPNRVVEIREVQASELRQSPVQWRRHPIEQRRALAGAIEQVGWAHPPIAWQRPDGRLELIDGHLRADIAGEALIKVVVLDVDETEAKALVAMIDPLADMARTDASALAELLAQVDVGSAELLAHLEEAYLGGEQVPVPGRTPLDAVPGDAAARTSPGDLWIMGEHRLLCGDATCPDDVARLMEEEQAALFATDPPFLIGYTGADRPRGSGKNWAGLYTEVEIADAEGFLRASFSAAVPHLRPDAAWYCWHAHKRASLIERIWEELGVLNHQQVIWAKPVANHSYSVWPWAHEPCLVGWRKGHKPRHDGDNSHVITTVWSLDYDGAVRQVGAAHPTQKPVECFARPMRKHTRAGEVCYEPFSGSGTQIISAELTGRRCYAMEISPVFCDVALARWEAYTGRAAERA